MAPSKSLTKVRTKKTEKKKHEGSSAPRCRSCKLVEDQGRLGAVRGSCAAMIDAAYHAAGGHRTSRRACSTMRSPT